MRIIHLLVIGALIFAAAYVYRIKMDSTARTEKVLRLHAEIREQRDAPRRCVPTGPSSTRRYACKASPSGICRSSRSTPRNMTH